MSYDINFIGQDTNLVRKSEYYDYNWSKFVQRIAGNELDVMQQVRHYDCDRNCLSKEKRDMARPIEETKLLAKAVVLGVGAEDGLGAALCRCYAANDRHVLVAGRTLEKVDKVAAAIRRDGGRATAYAVDATQEADVIRLFDAAMTQDEDGGPADLVTYNVGLNQKIDFLQMEASTFEDFWRMNTLGGFLVGREAARRFAPLGRGSIFFTGASGSLRGMPGFAHFAASKAGLRMISQSMAREFGPQGIHVAHIVVDGAIEGDRVRSLFPGFVEQLGENGVLNTEAIAQTYWQLHLQHPSAWTQELDVRPFKEKF
jgi:NAD(P)-dependent dehydrogenase (short-subunit alcohol dehydrogenase family)